jgi:streptogramin lyase
VKAIRRSIGVIAAGAALLLTAGPAAAATVSEFPLESDSISSLAQAPDGTILYSASHPYGTAAAGDHWLGYVGRVGPTGPLGETAVPPSFPGQIAVGSEGDAYLAPSSEAIARLTPGGEWSTTGVRKGDSEQDVTPAAGGGVWFVQRSDLQGDIVGRISASGQVSEFPIPTHESGANAIVEGHEGNAWFTEYFAGKIGRVTPSGEITEFSLPEGKGPRWITVDGEGNLWFTPVNESWIGKMTPDGVAGIYALPSGVTPGAVAAGPDGRIWFTDEVQSEVEPHYFETTRGIGRIDPTGGFSQVPLPDAKSDPVDLIAGAEGNVWYAAMGEGPCEGGGGTCMLWKPELPAIVGRVTVGPLRTTITKSQAPVWRNRVDVALACAEGNASETCRGSIEVKVGGRAVAKSRYLVGIDSTRQVVVKRLPRVPSLLKANPKHRGTLVVVHPDTGGRVRQKVKLVSR